MSQNNYSLAYDEGAVALEEESETLDNEYASFIKENSPKNTSVFVEGRLSVSS